MPAEAGIQLFAKAPGPRFRGDERGLFELHKEASFAAGLSAFPVGTGQKSNANHGELK